MILNEMPQHEISDIQRATEMATQALISMRSWHPEAVRVFKAVLGWKHDVSTQFIPQITQLQPQMTKEQIAKMDAAIGYHAQDCHCIACAGRKNY